MRALLILCAAAALAVGCRTPEPNPFDRLFDSNAGSLRDVKPVPGELHLSCDQADAEVLVDGVLQGSCSDFDGKVGALHLDDRGQLVEVRKSGFQTWQVRLSPGQTRTALQVQLAPMN